MPDIVALVAHGRRQVVGSVGLNVMMLNVMEVVRVPGMPHQRICDVREDAVKRRILLVQYPPHVDVLVHHQCVCPHEVYLHYRVQRAMPPVEVVEHIDGGRYARAEIEEEVGQHYDISVNADDCTGPANVGIDDQFAEGG